LFGNFQPAIVLAAVAVSEGLIGANRFKKKTLWPQAENHFPQKIS